MSHLYIYIYVYMYLFFQPLSRLASLGPIFTLVSSAVPSRGQLTFLVGVVLSPKTGLQS